VEKVRFVEDIMTMPGVETLEGRIGPLLSGEHGACHYIEMPAGAYCDEHPHSTESLIYTVRGQWVFCHEGRRWHMKQGNLFWFQADASTGFEVPFAEPAFILIFKSQGRAADDEFIEYLKGMAHRLEEQNRNGTPFTFDELPEEHPAKAFARELSGS
jgi:quercetin dioxygenase-like cupin family protein